MCHKMQLYNVLDIGVQRIDIIEKEEFQLTENKHQICIAPSDYCDKITGVAPYLGTLLQNITSFDNLIPHINTDHPVGKSFFNSEN